MADLSREDIDLLSRELPRLSAINVSSPLYAGGEGRVAYRAAGGNERPALLLLHGLGSSSAGYRAQLAGLSREFHVIAWNAPGFEGSTPISITEPRMDDYADVATAFLQALGIEQLAALVGSSWGSVIATVFAARQPAMVRELVLSAPNVARGHVTGEMRDAEMSAWLATADISLPVARSAIADRLLTPRTSPLVRRHVERLRDAMTTQGWRQAIQSLFTVSTPAILREVICPIELLAGDCDQVAPRQDHALPLAAAAPSANLHVFEGCGHMLKLEAPTRFNAIVRATASRTPRRQSTA
ncbi:alpha/beta fold hydrolase [Methylocapsa sp. S129]|uniref:alpha/beta fold hydrolase n=1 Tax=Methylocapsa sp. S129 TaxID=1641869 RepID=UPI00131CE5FE|nr:alpha/beta hydrolase [Methylocapsa sp. S129]